MVFLSIVLLIALLLIFFLVPAKWRQSNSDFMAFVASLVATFCGVAWAISLDTKSSERKEKQSVVGLMSVAQRDALIEARWVARRLAAKDGDDSVDIDEEDDRNFPYPRIWWDVINQEIVIRRLSPETFEAVQEMRVQLSTAAGPASSEQGEALTAIAGVLDAEARLLAKEFPKEKLALEIKKVRDLAVATDSLEGSWTAIRRKNQAQFQAWVDSIFKTMPGF